MEPNHKSQAGESGHQGQDRQPGKNISQAHEPTPGPGQSASPSQTRSRSKEAVKAPRPSAPDFVHPGPNRYEAEKSKGNLHHNQREPQPDMQQEFEDL